MRRLAGRVSRDRGARPAGLLILAAWLLTASPAPASASGPLDLHLAGDVKSFGFLSVIPYEMPSLSDDLLGQAALDVRLKLDLRYASWLRVDLHHRLTALTFSEALDTGLGPVFAGQGPPDPPEAVDLSWVLAEDPRHVIEGGIDRAAVRLLWPRLHLAAGRQAVTFGRAYFFTPLDLVAPFSPTVVDREYKPGIDALRADAFFGISGQVTALAAYAGSWDSEGMIFLGRAGATLGGWDLAVLGASVQRDAVLGLESSGAVGPVSVRAEGSVTFPSGDRDPFLRAVIGADHLLAGGRLVISGEVYHQSLGVTDPADLLWMALDPRVVRGELWTLGRWYAAVSAEFELNPLLYLNAFAVANLTDPSFLLGPGLTWSIADNMRLVAGIHVALGKRPEEDGPFGLVPGSEFGLYPTTVFVSLQGYF